MTEKNSLQNLKTRYCYCMHGLGAVKGLRQTNTLEAFNLWYKRGVRVFEFDLAKTDDNKYVAVAHTVDKKSMTRMEILEEPDCYSYEWFMKQRLFPLTAGGLTPLSLSDVFELLNSHKDCIFMLDLFGMFTGLDLIPFLEAADSLITNYNDINDRLLLEAYNRQMSDTISSHSSKYNIIYCVRYEGNTDKDGAVPIEYLKDKQISFVSYPWMYEKDFPGEIKAYSEAGITVFSRTKYNTKNKKLQAAGVSVNIVGYKFSGALILIQYPLYVLACVNRLISKVKIKNRQRH